MSDNGKRTAKTPAILILASFVIVVSRISLVRIALESYEKTRGLAFMLGSDTEIEWIEELEMADAIKREKKKQR
jgi:hypothetical protein